MWYKQDESDRGQYIESIIEDFVQGIVDGFQSLFGRLPNTATTLGLPGVCRKKQKARQSSTLSTAPLLVTYFTSWKKCLLCANACRDLSQHSDIQERSLDSSGTSTGVLTYKRIKQKTKNENIEGFMCVGL